MEIPFLQLYSFLYFLPYTATGSFQQVMGDCLDCAAGTVCKYFRRIAYRLANILSQLVSFNPTPETVRQFEDILGFATVVRAIQCHVTHAPVEVYIKDEVELFFCHKSYTFFNVQIVCKTSIQVSSIVQRWLEVHRTSESLTGLISKRWWSSVAPPTTRLHH